jgi:hypothetical protein
LSYALFLFYVGGSAYTAMGFLCFQPYPTLLFYIWENFWRLFALFGVPNTDALALSLLFGLTLLGASVIGGLIWIPMNARGAH